ncbi:MAG: PIN domain-containing protein [Halieaceae bacterium]|nr:PIN domain-containing protein [Halieaceae bacterium]
MTTSTLYYFVDTNLFIQCHPLEQLDWSPWHKFEQVRLIVSSPVLREIDLLKTKGNNRVGRRARAASAMFRGMIDETHKLVRDECPRVVLSVEPQHTYNRDLEGRLNYQERDDQLLGIIHEFVRSNPSSDVRLLTHDTTPMYTAQGLDLIAELISDDWLLPLETTETERKLAALEAENARLKTTEPSFSIRCKNQSDTVVDRCCASYTWYEPLTDAEVDGLMERLKVHFPMATDFGPKEPTARSAPSTVANRLFATIRIFTPATDKEIEKYREETYPQWLDHCEVMLREHHRTLQHETPVLEFTFLAENIGTRPATDALITIEARGKFQIKPPSYNDPDEEQEGEDDTTGNLEAKELPRPPIAPRGHWKDEIVGQPGEVLRNLNKLASSLEGLPGFAHIDPGLVEKPFALPSFNPPASRDPNAFYYKPDLPSMPQDSFALECAQWRHDNQVEHFVVEIHVSTDQDEVKGLLVCRIQAGNLSKSVSSCIPIRIAITHVSAFEAARSMVETLVGIP